MKNKLLLCATLLFLFVGLIQTKLLPMEEPPAENGDRGYLIGVGGGGGTVDSVNGDSDNPEALLKNLYFSEKPSYSVTTPPTPPTPLNPHTRPPPPTARILLFTSIGIPVSPYVIQLFIEWGIWGKWKKPALYVPFYYICGGQMQFEDSQGNKKDDTATNGLRFKFCKHNNWNDQQQRQFQGKWGDWKGMVMCPAGWYASDYNIRVVGIQWTGDDTAMNGLQLRCKNPANLAQTTDITVYDGIWGDWQGWHTVHSYNFMWAASVRWEAPKGGGDDTAMNGLAALLIP